MSQEQREDTAPRSLWARALWLADHTPESRNRYVDFLRALSILAVVTGHWLMAAPHLENGVPELSHLLDVSPWSQWLTWVFQVMPVFFFVGGFSNCVSWESARRKGQPYAEWLDGRLRRLLGPVLPLLIVWALMAAVARSQGVGPGMIRVGSRVALVPVWFLAVYILVIVVVPLSHGAWRRWGLGSIVAPVLCAVVVDVAFFAAGLRALGWANYLLVWLAVHQLGYAWYDRRLAGPRVALPLFGLGLVTLVALVTLGPYPLSLVGVPSDEISNTLPPKLPLLALAAAQIGLLLSLETLARRWLERRVPWACTVLVNGMIMTIFLWHSTVMMLLVGLAFWKLPVVVSLAPASGAWWAARPAWILVHALLSVPFLLIFSRFERPRIGDQRALPGWMQLAGGGLACWGLALLALDGVGGEGWLGLRWIPLILPILGAGAAGFGPLGGIVRKGCALWTGRG
jgi:hypothetical protein